MRMKTNLRFLLISLTFCCFFCKQSIAKSTTDIGTNKAVEFLNGINYISAKFRQISTLKDKYLQDIKKDIFYGQIFISKKDKKIAIDVQNKDQNFKVVVNKNGDVKYLDRNLKQISHLKDQYNFHSDIFSILNIQNSNQIDIRNNNDKYVLCKVFVKEKLSDTKICISLSLLNNNNIEIKNVEISQLQPNDELILETTITLEDIEINNVLPEDIFNIKDPRLFGDEYR
jgi:outer membrane lipoprotein-sorting protein